MNRKFSIFLAISFLAVQVFATLHMAEYANTEHKHHGHICEVYLYCEHAKADTPNAVVVPTPTEYVTFAIVLPELTLVRSKTYRISSPRAPPLFS